MTVRLRETGTLEKMPAPAASRPELVISRFAATTLSISVSSASWGAPGIGIRPFQMPPPWAKPAGAATLTRLSTTRVRSKVSSPPLKMPPPAAATKPSVVLATTLLSATRLSLIVNGSSPRVSRPPAIAIVKPDDVFAWTVLPTN